VVVFALCFEDHSGYEVAGRFAAGNSRGCFEGNRKIRRIQG